MKIYKVAIIVFVLLLALGLLGYLNKSRLKKPHPPDKSAAVTTNLKPGDIAADFNKALLPQNTKVTASSVMTEGSRETNLVTFTSPDSMKNLYDFYVKYLSVGGYLLVNKTYDPKFSSIYGARDDFDVNIGLIKQSGGIYVTVAHVIKHKK